MIEASLFYLFSLLAVLAGASVVTRHNAISSAVSLVVTMFALAAMYAMLGAHFVAIIQILVYAGAIMVLFIFVIMVLNLRGEGPAPWHLSPRAVAGAGVGGLVGLTALTGLSALRAAGLKSPGELPADFGTIESVGDALFRTWLLPFEVVSALLTVAVIGAVVLSKKEL